MRKIIPYNKRLIPLTKKIRQDMTFSEVLICEELKQSQLGHKFNRQTPIDNYIVDFYCKDLMLAIEIDGNTHHYDDQPQKDKVRQKRLESLEVSFLRFDDLDVKTNIKWVVNEILDWIETHPQPRIVEPLQGGD